MSRLWQDRAPHVAGVFGRIAGFTADAQAGVVPDRAALTGRAA